ncbi:MAG: surface lipoprotein assembly modifier [Gammaproteobacteria bacterium]
MLRLANNRQGVKHMRRLSVSANGILAVLALVAFGWAAAQDLERGATPAPPKAQGAGEPKKLSPQEVAELNAKLRQAMALYYDQSYRLALPLFQEIAQQAGTIDIFYWLGRTAAKVGLPDLAIEKFRSVLERDPKRTSVRLELALAYLKKGDRPAAEAELKKALEAEPPAGLREQIEQLAQYIERADKRVAIALRASIGPAFDNNINVAPTDSIINRDDGAVLRTGERLEGWFIDFDALADLFYDFGKKDAFAWRGDVFFLHHEYPGSANSEFNYTQIDARSALEYGRPEFRIRLPGGFIDRRFSNEDLSHAFYVAPSADYYLRRDLRFTVGYRYEDEEFVDDADDEQSNVTHIGSFGPNYRFAAVGADHFVSLIGAYASRDANAERFSYKDWSIGPSYVAQWKSGTQATVYLRYLGRDYDAPAPDFETSGDRKEHRYTAVLSLSQTFYRNYFVSASFSYIRNDSNVALFDYDKLLAGINLGVNFNF